MSALNRIGLVGAAALAGAGVGAPASGAETFGQALAEGKLLVDLRARFESVEQDGFEPSADALTNRLRVGFQTAPLAGTENTMT